jgi:oxalate decarboxylase
MNANEYDAVLERLSRRRFLKSGSAALAMTALGATALRGQERASTQAAEHDHSSSDPGSENKSLLDENPNSNTPPPTDHGDVVPLWYSFDIVKKRVEEGGWTHEVTQRELPSSTDIAGVNMRLTAGSYRELHWHTADEWAYVLYGKARVTVMSPEGQMFIGDVSEGDLWLAPHYIENTGDTDAVFLEMLATDVFEDVSLNQWLRRLPAQMVQAHLGFDKATLAKIPDGKLIIV